MEEILDIFRNDAFSYTSLQRVVDKAPFVPTMLGDMRIYQPKPISTREVLIYEKDGGYALIPYSEVGGPDAQQARREGRLYALSTKRISKKDTVRAGELTGILSQALNPASRVRAAMELVDERTGQLKTDMEATKEFARLGPLFGKLIDPITGGVLLDYYDVFGIDEPDVIDVDFTDEALDEDNALMYFQETVYQPMVVALGNRATPGMRIGALCGDEFWGKLMRLKAFRKLYEIMLSGNMMAMQQNPLAKPNLWETVYFGGIYWTHFRNSTSGDISVESDEARIFPIGAKDVFNVYWGPGEKFEDATIKGKPEYLYLELDPRRHPEWIDIVLRSYPLYANLFPAALLTLKIA